MHAPHASRSCVNTGFLPGFEGPIELTIQQSPAPGAAIANFVDALSNSRRRGQPCVHTVDMQQL